MIRGMNDAEIDASIGRQLQTFRETQNMSRERLAEEMMKRGFSSWTRQTVWNVEVGRRALKFAEGREIEVILGRDFTESQPREAPRWKQLQRSVNAGAARFQNCVESQRENVSDTADCAELACRALREASLGMAAEGVDAASWDAWSRLAFQAAELGEKCVIALDAVARGAMLGDDGYVPDDFTSVVDVSVGNRISSFLHDFPIVLSLCTLAAQEVLHSGGNVAEASEAAQRAGATDNEYDLMGGAVNPPAWVVGGQAARQPASTDAKNAKDVAQ